MRHRRRAWRASLARIAVWAIVAMALGSPQERAAHAQPAPAVVLTVDMDRVFTESAPARSIAEQAEALRIEIRADLDQRRGALQREEERLSTIRVEIDDETFEQRSDAFKEAVRALRRDSRQAAARLQRGLGAAREQLRRSVTPLLVALMEERGAQVMIDDSQVVLRANSVDVTDEVIRRLDLADPQIEVSLPAVREP